MSTYSSTVSTARLSDVNILTKTTGGLVSRVSRSFSNAREIAERVDENRMLQTVQQLEKVLTAHDLLKELIKLYVATEATSVGMRLKLLSTGISKMLVSSIKLSRSLHKEMSNVYTKYVDHLITDVTRKMNAVDTLYAEVTSTFATSQDDNSVQIQSLISQLDFVLQSLMTFDIDLNATTAYASQLFPKRLLASAACQNAKIYLNATIVERTTWLAGFPFQSKFEAKEDLSKASNIRSLLKQTSNCMHAYKSELDSFSKWLDLVTLPQFSSHILSLSEMDALEADSENLKYVQQRFVSGSLTKKELTQQYLDIVYKQTAANADSLVNTVQQSFFAKLSTNINSFEEWMKSFFETLFAKHVNLQRYMDKDDNGVEKYARNQPIWRKPSVNFQSSQVSISALVY